MKSVLIELDGSGEAAYESLKQQLSVNGSTVVARALHVYAIALGVADDDGRARIVPPDGGTSVLVELRP